MFDDMSGAGQRRKNTNNAQEQNGGHDRLRIGAHTIRACHALVETAEERHLCTGAFKKLSIPGFHVQAEPDAEADKPWIQARNVSVREVPCLGR